MQSFGYLDSAANIEPMDFESDPQFDVAPSAMAWAGVVELAGVVGVVSDGGDPETPVDREAGEHVEHYASRRGRGLDSPCGEGDRSMLRQSQP